MTDRAFTGPPEPTDDKPTVKPLRPCHGCGIDHGSVNAERLCLERALERARTALREAAEALNRT